MYLNFGKWIKKTRGIHQKNMNSFIWENVKLLDENNNLFTVVADGAETESDFFASIKIFDDTQKDCLYRKLSLPTKIDKSSYCQNE